ncbi:lipocalin-like domain-containing protein [Marinobacterium jannaschii]|uniref:lipocalin-like domain-containing protein n=1 Tax=Marinobacterium jannaschii TaxID=64970 RepID=UPI0006860045|nr:lipocalin-like domain-containing protein [Marinobacterium jannaschii]
MGMIYRFLAGLLAVAILVSMLSLFITDEAGQTADTAFDLGDFLGDAGSDDAFRKARPDYRIALPRDHLAHPGFRSEWWYLNGNLQRQDDPRQRYGFNFTIFRQALAPESAEENPWLRPQFYMGHLAIADFATGEHRSSERFARAGPGIAGTAGQPLRVWLDNWQLTADRDESLFPALLEARDRSCDCGYRLQIEALKVPAFQGKDGYSPKRQEPGFASHYYSFTRLRVHGELWLGPETIPVSGSAWYDHEWASNTLADYQQGWDWFSLQLEDGRDLMFIRLRSRLPGRRDFDQLSVVDQTGQRIDRPGDSAELVATDYWVTDDGVRYPVSWQLRVPSQGLDLVIRARQPEQEMRHSMRYWEGAVSIAGSHPGQGYVELTGYAGNSAENASR